VSRIVIGMADAAGGLDLSNFSVTADFEIDGAEPGRQLASRFQPASPGVWQWKLKQPLTAVKRGTLVVQVSDHDRNVTRLERTFSVTDR
jgi:hypothetical protein